MKINPLLLAGFFFLAGPAGAREFDSSFWSAWGDGQAELSGYSLTFPRYGENRKGTAVLIFVTEPFSRTDFIKADAHRPKRDVFQVMKLNLVRDFPTGVYDYNLMTSAFVSLEPVLGGPAGSPVKVSFSSQEWCGHVYHQVLFDTGKIREDLHSYFDGEADQTRSFSRPDGAASEDILFHWARGFAEPFLNPGQKVKVPLLTSLLSDRLNHTKTKWTSAELSVSDNVEKIKFNGEPLAVRVYQAAVEGGPTWTFHVEEEAPRRIIQWETSDGEKGLLLKTERMPYWKMNAAKFEDAVKKLGL